MIGSRAPQSGLPTLFWVGVALLLAAFAACAVVESVAALVFLGERNLAGPLGEAMGAAGVPGCLLAALFGIPGLVLVIIGLVNRRRPS